MTFKSFFAGCAGLLAVAGLAVAAPSPAQAAEALPSASALALDGQTAEFTMTAAKARRLEIIRNTNRRIAGRSAYGRPGRPAYGRYNGERPGYGPRAGWRRGY